MYEFFKVWRHILLDPPCHKLSHLLGPPWSVTYFMYGPLSTPLELPFFFGGIGLPKVACVDVIAPLNLSAAAAHRSPKVSDGGAQKLSTSAARPAHGSNRKHSLG